MYTLFIGVNMRYVIEGNLIKGFFNVYPILIIVSTAMVISLKSFFITETKNHEMEGKNLVLAEVSHE